MNNPSTAAAKTATKDASLDQSIAVAQQGRVNVTPAKAIEMAGRLFTAGKFRQAEKVCRQIIESRPGQADAHNILGVTLNALGNSKDAIASLKRAIKRRPFEVRWNHDFRATMKSCAERERTWIDATILESYCLLHRLGYAHSVECYDEEGLQGKPSP